MAEVVITMKDVENGQVDINVEFNPPLEQFEDKDVTVAQVAAVAAMSYLTQVFFDESEPEATQEGLVPGPWGRDEVEPEATQNTETMFDPGAIADWENEGGA